MRPVLGAASVAGFHMAKLALENPARMINLSRNLHYDPVDLLVELVQPTTLESLARDAPEVAAGFREGRLSARMDVSFVGPDGRFLTVKQLVPDLAVVGLGGGRLQTVDDAAVGIHALMCFHAKVPVIALLCY